MTKALAGADVARRIDEVFPGAALGSNKTDVWVAPQDLHKVAKFIHDDEVLDCAMLLAITCVDFVEWFELVYHVRSMRKNHTAVVKTRLPGREEFTIASVVDIWQGADLQEREVWDLMGVRFEGHPNMKRVLLWEGFPGHPLRKDFVR
jgi:NADH-quinone oxidoreductase subunit C